MLIKNDDSPVSFPLLNPYGHVAFQAQRGDVHTVLVDGRVVKREQQAGRRRPRRRARGRSRPPSTTCRATMGEEVWQPGMNPELPERSEVLDNPYQYTDYQSDSTREARGTIFGEPGSGQDGGREMAGRGTGTGLRRGARARARRARVLRRRATAR